MTTTRIFFGSKFRRRVFVGEEGGEPPILIKWYRDDGACVGIYERESMDKPAETWGPLFDGDWGFIGDAQPVGA